MPSNSSSVRSPATWTRRTSGPSSRSSARSTSSLCWRTASRACTKVGSAHIPPNYGSTLFDKKYIFMSQIGRREEPKSCKISLLERNVQFLNDWRNMLLHAFCFGDLWLLKKNHFHWLSNSVHHFCCVLLGKHMTVSRIGSHDGLNAYGNISRSKYVGRMHAGIQRLVQRLLACFHPLKC